MFTQNFNNNMPKIPKVDKNKLNEFQNKYIFNNDGVNNIRIDNFHEFVKKLAISTAQEAVLQKVRQGAFTGVLQSVAESVVDSSKNNIVPWSQLNSVRYTNDKIGSSFITKTHFSIGYHYGTKIKKLKSSPYHQNQTVTLENTETDRINHLYRKLLTSTIGFNQKGFDILDSSTFLTINDIKLLASSYEGNITKNIQSSLKIKETISEFLKNFDKTKEIDIEDLLQKLNINEDSLKIGKNYPSVERIKKTNKKIERVSNYLTLTKITTRLKIKNLLSQYLHLSNINLSIILFHLLN